MGCQWNNLGELHGNVIMTTPWQHDCEASQGRSINNRFITVMSIWNGMYFAPLTYQS